MIGRDNLVPGRQREIPGDHVHGCGRVRKEHHIVGAHVQKLPESSTRLRHQLRSSSLQPRHRVAFHLTLQALVGVLHSSWNGAKRAVIEEHKVRVEKKIRTGRERHGVEA